jgi:MoxR-like ATPase
MAGYYSMEQIEEYQKAIPTVAINYDQYDPKNIDVWDTYIPIDDEKQRALDAVLSARTPYLIESEKGQGKTLLIYTICKENNIALIEEQVGRGTRITDLFGSKEINRDGTLFNLGIFPKAIEVANHFGHACLYCDEGNTQDPEIQKLWNRICDGRKSVFVNGKNYKLNPNCKLSIVWTTNPVTYAGINSMPEDLRSRFIGDVWDYPSNEQIKKVIDLSNCIPQNKTLAQGDGFAMIEKIDTDSKKSTGSIIHNFEEYLLTFVQDIHALRMKGDVEYSLSIRDIKQFCDHLQEMIQASGSYKSKLLEKAIKQVILFKFEDPGERELVKIRANDTFGVKL